jgi:hypothetical protein
VKAFNYIYVFGVSADSSVGWNGINLFRARGTPYLKSLSNCGTTPHLRTFLLLPQPHAPNRYRPIPQHATILSLLLYFSILRIIEEDSNRYYRSLGQVGASFKNTCVIQDQKRQTRESTNFERQCSNNSLRTTRYALIVITTYFQTYHQIP